MTVGNLTQDVKSYDDEELHLPPSWEPLRIACPVCRNTYLHQELVEVWEGASEVTLVGRIVGDCVPDASANPSPYRDDVAIRIRFWCEGDHCVPALDVWQHEGETYIGWSEQP